MTLYATSTHGQTSRRALWLGAALAVPLFIPSVAAADVACGDTTCPNGFVCKTYDSYDCATTDVGTAPASEQAASGGAASVAPAAGGSATPTDNEKIATRTPCAPSVGYTCAPAPCTIDADCGPNMVCYTSTTSQCSGASAKPTCAPDSTNCAEIESDPPVCTTSTIQQCAYRYEVPCKVAADCGVGFTCEESQSCGCSGSSGVANGGAASTGGALIAPEPSSSAPSDDESATSSGATGGGGATGVATGGARLPAETSCSCESTGVFYCKLQNIACGTDTDCPSGLLCVEATRSTCAVSTDGTTTCPTTSATKTCQPPYRGSLGIGEAASDSSSNDGKSEAPTASGDLTGTQGSASNGADGSGAEHATDSGNGAQPDVSGGGCSIAQPVTANYGRALLLALAVGLTLLRRGTRAKE